MSLECSDIVGRGLTNMALLCVPTGMGVGGVYYIFRSGSNPCRNRSVRPSPPPPQDPLPVILETLVGENRRLHWQLRENNTVLDLKIKELQECLEAKERDQSRE